MLHAILLPKSLYIVLFGDREWGVIIPDFGSYLLKNVEIT